MTALAALVGIAVSGCVANGSSSSSAGFVGSSSSTASHAIGQKVVYQRGRTFHLEIFLAPSTELTQKILQGRDNPVMQAKKTERAKRGRPASYKEDYPESRAYDVFDAVAKFGYIDFATGGTNGCVFDVVLHDVNAAAFGPAMVLDKHDRFTGGALAPRILDSRTVVYENLRVIEAAPLVLPNGPGVYGSRPVAELVSKAGRGCRIMNPGSDGKSLTYSMRHRIDNVGQLVAVLIGDAGHVASR